LQVQGEHIKSPGNIPRKCTVVYPTDIPWKYISRNIHQRN